MFSLIVLFLSIFSYPGNNTEMLVRVYTSDYEDLNQIDLRNLDIAGRSYDEYFDLVVTHEEYQYVLNSGLEFEVISDNLNLLKEEFKGNYHSYDQTNTILRNYASTFSTICKLDSIGLSYEGRWVYALKISDNPSVEDPNEPGVLFDGLHHAREWATVEVILFYADTLINGYGSDPTITDLVNNTEIWLVPIVNPDGYVYDYPGQNWWRKNRKPYGGSIGTDPNRNYNGALNGDPHGDWCAVPSSGSMSNNPGSNVFCGAYAGWADVVDAMMDFHRTHDINANITYHSYAEEIIWPWAYNTSIKTPDSIAYEFIANQLSSRIQRLGGGNYVASGSLYPNTGTTRTWVYGYHHFICGTSCLAYTIEVGTSFYQPTGDLDNIVRENWDGALYLAMSADSIRQYLLPRVPSPVISVPDTAPANALTINWTPVSSQWTNTDRWQIDDLENYTWTTDDLESGTSNWELNGFTLSTARSHSSSHSLYSGHNHNISNVAQTKYPYIVQSGDTFSFWCWFSLENNYDVTTVEISTDLKEWIQLDERYTGNSSTWIQKKYSLEDWIGKAVYLRLRTVTDGGTLNENFYVDDIYPVPAFGSISVVDSNITDTLYNFSSISEGVHYFRVRGYNSRGWGNYSNTEKVVVIPVSYVDELDIVNTYSVNINTDSREISISYNFPNIDNINIQLFDLSGRKVDEFNMINQIGSHTLRINTGRSGVWFVRIISDNINITEKVFLIQ